jgi:L-fuculose-phosphate aldolase
MKNQLLVQASIASHALSLNGHDDFNQGQVSVRRPQHANFFIKSANLGFDEAHPDGFVEASVDHTVVPNPQAPPELPLHQAIYRARPDVNGIVHSHAPAGLVFGALDQGISAIGHEGAMLEGQVAHFSATSNTVLNIDMANSIAEVLDSNVAVFLVNHGSIVVGKSIKHAVIFAIMLERACRLQLDALATDLPYKTSSEDDIVAKRDFIYSDLSIRSYWEHMERAVARRVPEVQSWA